MPDEYGIMIMKRRAFLSGVGAVAITSGCVESVAQQQSNGTGSTATEQAQGAPDVEVQSDGIHRQDSWLGLDHETVEQSAHEKVNQLREERPIRFSNDLARIARFHSWDMAQRDYYSHESPDGNDHSDRYSRFGYNCDEGSAENILQTWAFTDVEGPNGDTVQYSSSKEVGHGTVEEWVESPGHNEILRDSQWRAEGIGAWWIRDEQYDGVKVYITQNFC